MINLSVIPCKVLGRLFGLEFVYWGKSQKHKFRWNVTHIDLGMVSIYNLPQKGLGKLFWGVVAFLVKPLRRRYHRKYVYSIDAQVNQILNNPFEDYNA